MSEPTPILAVRDLTVAFETARGGARNRVLDAVSLTVRRGTTLAVVGESGSGKTVLGQTILRLLPKEAAITGGSIMLYPSRHPDEAVDLLTLPAAGREMRALRGRALATIFQEPMAAFSPLHTIGNQIIEAARVHRTKDYGHARTNARDMLARTGFPDPDQALELYPFELSGGMRQRAMIAMALICHPDILIADEPTTALDVTTQARILDLLRDLQRDLGITVILITHDFGVVASMADEIAVMHRGRIVESGTTRHIFREAEHSYVRRLLKAVPRLVPAEPQHAPGRPHLLSVTGLTKIFQPKRKGLGKTKAQSVTAVRDVTFTVWQGECLGIVGESGSGKSTVAKLIMGAMKPDRGMVTFHGQGESLAVQNANRAALKAFRRKVHYVFQDPFSALNPSMSVWDILREPMIIHKTRNAAEQKTRIQDVLALVGLDPETCSRFPHAFSGGQRQRIGIARALMLEPELLLLDEPTSSLDVSVQAQIIELLTDLKERLGLTYVFVSHNLILMQALADRIAVMCAGRLVEIGPAHAVFADARHPYTQALLTAVPRPDPDPRPKSDSGTGPLFANPFDWPAPYQLANDDHAVMVDLGGGHSVAVSPKLTEGRMR